MKSPHLLGKLEHTPGLQAELVVDPGLLNPELFFFFKSVSTWKDSMMILTSAGKETTQLSGQRICRLCPKYLKNILEA